MVVAVNLHRAIGRLAIVHSLKTMTDARRNYQDDCSNSVVLAGMAPTSRRYLVLALPPGSFSLLVGLAKALAALPLGTLVLYHYDSDTNEHITQDELDYLCHLLSDSPAWRDKVNNGEVASKVLRGVELPRHASRSHRSETICGALTDRERERELGVPRPERRNVLFVESQPKTFGLDPEDDAFVYVRPIYHSRATVFPHRCKEYPWDAFGDSGLLRKPTLELRAIWEDALRKQHRRRLSGLAPAPGQPFDPEIHPYYTANLSRQTQRLVQACIAKVQNQKTPDLFGAITGFRRNTFNDIRLVFTKEGNGHAELRNLLFRYFGWANPVGEGFPPAARIHALVSTTDTQEGRKGILKTVKAVCKTASAPVPVSLTFIAQCIELAEFAPVLVAERARRAAGSSGSFGGP